MGTSVSSKGPGGNVPFVPPWVPPIEPLPPPDPNQSPPDAPPNPEIPANPKQNPPNIAPPRRFAGTRNSFARFARTGLSKDLAKGLSHYTKKGLGGVHRATERLAGTAKTAGTLYGVFDALRTGEAPPVDLGVDPDSLKGRPAKEVGDQIAEAIRPVDGTQDAEASRNSISLAVADLATQYPEVDLTALSQEQIEFITERYIAYDLCNRIQLDVGKTVYDKAPNWALGTRRLEEMKHYVREKVSSCFRAVRERGQHLTRRIARALSATVIKETFLVFEEYTQ